MDELFVVHVSNVGEASGLGEYEGKQLNLQVDKPFPHEEEMLRVRCDLFKKVVQEQQSKATNRKGRRRKRVDAFTV